MAPAPAGRDLSLFVDVDGYAAVDVHGGFADQSRTGMAPQTYGLERSEAVHRQASRSWLYLHST